MLFPHEHDYCPVCSSIFPSNMMLFALAGLVTREFFASTPGQIGLGAGIQAPWQPWRWRFGSSNAIGLFKKKPIGLL